MNRPLLVSVWLLAGRSLAGGFGVPEQDAAAMGRCGTAVAEQQAPSAVFYNPAGLAGLAGASAQVGATAILPSATATDAAGNVYNTEGGLKVPPHAYAAYGGGRVALGLGFNAPYGGGMKWPQSWSGRYDLVEMQLQVLAAHAGLSYRLSDQLAAGAGASLYQLSVTVDQRLDFVDGDGRALIGGSGTGFGAQAGLVWTPNTDVAVGLTGRLPSRVGIQGRAHFEDVPSSFAAMLPDQAVRTSLTLPARLASGARWRTGVATWLADVEYTFWSSYRTFEVQFENADTPSVSQPRNWKNTFTVRVGGEKPVGKTLIRAGALFDQAASPSDTLSPSLPDSNRLGFSLGAGRDLGPVHADLAYAFVAFLPRQATGEAFAAKYSSFGHLLSLSVSMKNAFSEALSD